MKGEAITIEDPAADVDEIIAQRVADGKIQAEQTAPMTTYFPKIHLVEGGWSRHNGYLASKINSLDPDAKTAQVGQSTEILLKSFGIPIVQDSSFVCVVISACHYTYLKAKRKFGGE